MLAFDDFSREEKCGERVKGISKRLHERSDPWSLGLNFDATGTERLFGSHRELVRRVSEIVSFHGFLSRIAIAPTLGLSWGLSRFGKERVSIIEDATRETLKTIAEDLPVQAYRLSKIELAELRELEIHTGRELLRLPRATLLDRFHGGILKRLDQMLGSMEEVLPRCRIFFPVFCARTLDVPIEDAAVIAFHARQLLEQFVKEVAAAHQRIASFRIEITPIKGAPLLRTFRLSAPSLETAYLWRLLEPMFERLSLGSAVKEIQLRSVSTEERQMSQLPEENERRKSFGQLLDVIGEHLGPEEVQEMVCHASHIPERSFSYVPRNSAETENNTVQPLHEEERPSLLFYKPSPIKVIAPLPDGPPAWLEWREKRYRISCAIGPERIAPVWWGEDTERFQTKDYFRVQVPTGSWLWIFRQNTTWFIHGIWT